MTLRLPNALVTSDDADALELLHRYYKSPPDSKTYHAGSQFDDWDSTGTRQADTNRFTADDAVAVSHLSVSVTPLAATQLLRDHADRFTELLTELGGDRDLAHDDSVMMDGWVGWTLLEELQRLPGVGPVTATKLLARKRPKLRPIYDSVIADVTGSTRLWKPLHTALNSGGLQQRLLHLREAAGLGEYVPALRIFDVIAWREGKDRGLGTRREG